ncbi:hypothetical protein Pmar_PMAR022965 [Perkinsus marinus ATCC 50983]|uniref:Chromo domain-containing protein n=1 Tax=Perkinsus marinus (strain ATCC 50983 / TXsc) TaxID=423536 RepID=C5LHR4_PERM5|nr:hypothetical protein Pmar_PMAR022965 [Perkinsus marinus ATCC 50983]EER03668.1 hypothetical protein Pmar_PMAR022965 [Perkinsus marinus ATCC 50983]|eukprot:XP_002771852.1 hypothetical protein Pmar_PMAR022965 [Perkinsus marinus ATCC 50983]
MAILVPRLWSSLAIPCLWTLALAADEAPAPQSRESHLINKKTLIDFGDEVSAWLHKVYQAVWVEQPVVVFNLLTFLLGLCSVTLLLVMMIRQFVFKAREEADRSQRKRKPSIVVSDSAFEKSSSARRRGSRDSRHIVKNKSDSTQKMESPAAASMRSSSHRAKPKSHSSRTSTPQRPRSPQSSIVGSDSAEEHIRSRPSPVPTKISGDDGKVYEIDSIVDSRGADDEEEFLVTWVGYPPTASTWEPVENLPRMSKPSSLRAFILLALTRMAEVALADGMEGQYWQARIQEAWQESVEWWSKVYKVTWSDQPQNVYNLLAIGASFIVVVVSLILGSRHITRTMEEEAHIAAAALTADEDVSTEEGPGDASGDDRSKATKKKGAKTNLPRPALLLELVVRPRRRLDRNRSLGRGLQKAPLNVARVEPGRQMMYYIAAQIIRHTAVTEKVAMACPKELEVNLEGEHSLQVEVTKRGVWGNYLVLEVCLVGVPQDVMIKSKGLLVGSTINVPRGTSCPNSSYRNAIALRNAERLLQEKLPSEISHKLAGNGLEADVVIKDDQREQELYQTVMIDQNSREEDSDEYLDDWTLIERDYVIVDPADAVVD